jgi:hypothetical protein
LRKIRNFVALLLLTCSGESQQQPSLGPDRKPLPGRPGGASVLSNQMTAPQASYLLLQQIADRAEAQQQSELEQLSGAFENPHVTWKKTSDTFYSFEFDGMTVGVTRFPGGVRSIELLKTTPKNQPQQMFGSLAIFAANLPNCADAFWVQYVGRRYEFKTRSSTTAIRKNLVPEIDGGIPYQIQIRRGPGSAVMTDFAGFQEPLGTTVEKAAKDGIDAYQKQGSISADGITQLVARYRFWSYVICLKPNYVAGHFEWGYNTHLDAFKPPYVEVESEPTRWIQNF